MFSEKAKDILSYIDDHPMNCKGAKMTYQPMSKLDSTRLPDVVAGLNRDDVIVASHESGRINRRDVTKTTEHMADVTVAMLYMPCGGLDEAHDIVLPYSWDFPTHLAGQPVTDSPASHESRYAHALVHRKEGDNESEGGMIGWQNACFWFGRTGYHPLFPVVKQKVLEKLNNSRDVNDSDRKFVLSTLGKSEDWDPDLFSSLCEAAVGERGSNPGLEKFCSEVTHMEWRMLLDTCNNIVNPSGGDLKY